MVGAPWLARITYVVLPAALPGVIAAWLIGFIFCLRDLLCPNPKRRLHAINLAIWQPVLLGDVTPIFNAS